jgi:hypothetical protein
MENTLELYHRSYDASHPVVCMDETTKQLTKEVIEPLPAQPGQPERFDTLYQRNGVATIFMMFEPLSGWRRASVTESKTRLDWAWQIKRLLDEDYPNVEKVHLVLDNLNTHGGASLYEAFTPQEARRLLARLEFHHTPKHGSWLNMAEIELSVLSRQCLQGRIADALALTTEMDAWQANRNQRASKAQWQFTTADARIKLSKLYPSL